MTTESILCKKDGRKKYFSQEQLDLLGTQDGKHDGWEKVSEEVKKSTGIVKTLQTEEKEFVFPDDLKNHEEKNEDGQPQLQEVSGKKFPKEPKKPKDVVLVEENQE